MPEASSPIEWIGDVASHWEHNGSRQSAEFDTWIHGLVKRDDVIRDITERGSVKPGDIETIAFWHDISLIMAEGACLSNPSYVKSDQELRHPWYEEETRATAQSIPDADRITLIFSDERTYSDEEIFGITEAHFGATITYLKSGNRRDFWPANINQAQEQIGDWDEARDLESMLALAVSLDNANGNEMYQKRITAIVVELGCLYAEHGHNGRAIGLLSTLTSSQGAERLLNAVCDRLELDREKYGEEYYQRDYSYAAELLQGENRELLKQRLQPGKTPLIPGAIRFLKAYGRDGNYIMSELFSEDEPITAVLNFGDQIELPFVNNRRRALLNFRTEREEALYEMQYSVDFGSLPVEAQSRVRQFKDQTKGQKPPITTVAPQLLVFDIGYKVKTMDISKGEWKIMDIGSPHAVTDPKYFNNIVDDLEEIGRDWMVVDSEGTYMHFQGYSAQDVQRTAPAAANTFWFSARPREVWQGDDKLNCVIVPIVFYKAELQD